MVESKTPSPSFFSNMNLVSGSSRESGSSLRVEFVAGMTTFFTIAYVLIVHPKILATPETGMPFSGVLTATVLLCFFLTLLMGLYAKLPFAVAPGMGVNAFFAATLIVQEKIPWPTALGMVFWSGVLFVLISVTPLRTLLARAIPQHLRMAIAAGMGLFLAFLGFQQAGFLAANPDTLLTWQPMGLKSVLSLFGLVMAVLLLRRKHPLALLFGILGATFLSWCFQLTKIPHSFLSWPDFRSVLFKLDLWGALKWSLVPSIVSLFFTDFFDSLSTFVGVAEASGLKEPDGKPLRLKQGLIVDAFATLFAGLLGTSSGTAYLESMAGIEVGGKTGRTAMVAAFCFLPCLFFAPLFEMVPEYCTAPVLILVGIMMFRSVFQCPLAHWEDILPMGLVIFLMPFTFSITQGILWGFSAHVLLYLLVGRRKELSWAMISMGTLSIFLLLYQHHVLSILRAYFFRV